MIECDIKHKKSEFDGKMLLKTTIEAQIEANISKVKKKKKRQLQQDLREHLCGESVLNSSICSLKSTPF